MNKTRIKFYCDGSPFSKSEYYRAENYWRYAGGNYDAFRFLYGYYK